LLDSVTVFETTDAARQHLTAAVALPLAEIPATFAGTVVEGRMFIVAPTAYEATWRTLYPTWPWSDREYHRLIVHEVAHRAHELVAIARHGSADAMGPNWFFEGLAVACAGQFADAENPMSKAELQRHIGAGRVPQVSYPFYGRLVRSLAAHYGMQTLLQRSHEAGFPDVLWAGTAAPEPRTPERR
jgi:hypothetical protein